MKKGLSLILGLLFVLFVFPRDHIFAQSPEMITVTLEASQQAFKNPMKGFRPTRFMADAQFPAHEYASTYKHYIRYTDLEPMASSTAQDIIDWCNLQWAGLEATNSKVIPRVIIEFPNYPDGGQYWPVGITHSGTNNTPADWGQAALKERFVIMASKLAQAWDNDPRVAAVEMGLWGRWGEHNIVNGQLPADFEASLGAVFSQAFQNKQVLVRYPTHFRPYAFGHYWDSFAHPQEAAIANNLIALDHWRTQMITGEVAYDWGDQTQLGGSPNGTLQSNSNTDYVIDWVQRTHASSLGWISEYTATGQDAQAIAYNAQRLQKEMGYRFVLQQASFNAQVAPGQQMQLSFTVANVGNAPFYYEWPVQVSLLNDSRTVVWSDLVRTDVRKWLPGTSKTITDCFTLPASLPAGEYIVALSVLDPAGGMPSLRFANNNYFTGGRTPLGKIGVGQAVQNQILGDFDSLQADGTLGYSLSGPVVQPAEIAPEQLLGNAGFENGTAQWAAWNNCNVSVVTSPVASGQNAVRVSGRGSIYTGVQQDIKAQLLANGKGAYELSGAFRTSADAQTIYVSIMIKDDTGSHWYGAPTYAAANATGWTVSSGIKDIRWTGVLQEAKLYCETTNSKADYYVDEFSLKKVAQTMLPTTTELVQNSSFENGTNGWTPWNNSSLSAVASPVRSGTKALKVSGRANAYSGVKQDIKTTLLAQGPGNYELSAWFQTASGQQSFYISVFIKDGSGSHWFGAPVYANATNTGWSESYGLKNITWTGTLQTAEIYCESTSGTGVFYVDDISLKKT